MNVLETLVYTWGRGEVTCLVFFVETNEHSGVSDYRFRLSTRLPFRDVSVARSVKDGAKALQDQSTMDETWRNISGWGMKFFQTIQAHFEDGTTENNGLDCGQRAAIPRRALASPNEGVLVHKKDITIIEKKRADDACASRKNHLKGARLERESLEKRDAALAAKIAATGVDLSKARHNNDSEGVTALRKQLKMLRTSACNLEKRRKNMPINEEARAGCAIFSDKSSEMSSLSSRRSSIESEDGALSVPCAPSSERPLPGILRKRSEESAPSRFGSFDPPVAGRLARRSASAELERCQSRAPRLEAGRAVSAERASPDEHPPFHLRRGQRGQRGRASASPEPSHSVAFHEAAAAAASTPVRRRLQPAP
jgi:hypothetical protein